jgi:hypothetical protein
MNSKLSTASIAFIRLFFPGLALAADFDPSFLISDTEITNYKSMDQLDIQNFLERRNGTLENYLTFDKEGTPKTAVQSFYEIAQQWHINPKYLLVLTQKEQSLLEDPNPSQKQYDWATGYGVCDNCSMDDPNIQRFKGFYRQVNSAAAQTRYYMDNINEFNFKPGKTFNIDGQSVQIKNTATAGLFNYTPHLHGNQVFWNLWSKYFGKGWPDGSLLVANDGDQVYYIENDVKRLIVSKAILASRFDANKIIEVDQTDLDSYDDGAPIKYLNFSILKNSATGEMYMISDDIKRRIVSLAVFTKLGFSEDDIELAIDSELALYKDGPDITEYTTYPTGILLQDANAKKPFENIYYVISGEKHLVPTKEILDANFAGLKIKKVSSAELDNYMPSSNIVLPEGWIVKSSTALKYKIVNKQKIAINPEVSAVYVISGGELRPFISGKVFSEMGYKSKNVKLISDATLKQMPQGNPIIGN